MSQMSTLHEIAVEYANKQPGMIDALTEDSPILDVVKWQPSTHGLWNLAEKMTDVKGPGFVKPDAPLPHMSAASELVHTDLHIMGGTMEVPSLKAKKLGGPEKYFAKYQDKILRKAGMDTEMKLVMDNWYAAARSAKNIRSAGGTGSGWFMLAVRFDELANCGLFDPDQFDSGRFFRIDVLHGGNEDYLIGKGLENVLGYTIVYRTAFGWQILDAKRTCSAIVNIEPGKYPTADQIDDMLADVRATPANTYIFCSPRARTYGLNPHKKDHIMLTQSDKDGGFQLESWTGIPIVMSHNLNEPISNVSTGA